MSTADRFYEDFAVGEVYRTPGFTLTDGLIIDFALLYDPQRFHIDAEAGKDTIYRGLIASGWQVAALSFRQVVQSGVVRGGSLGSPGIDELRWLKPVRPGDTLHTEMTVLEMRPSERKADRGYVVKRYDVVNQRGETVTTYRGTQIMRRRPAGAPG